MFVKCATLFTDRPCCDINVDSYRLDLFSNRIQCIQSAERCAFGGLSSRVIAQRSRRRVTVSIDLLCVHLIKSYIGLIFCRWRNSVDTYSARRVILFKRYEPVWSHLAVSALWCYRKGLQKLCGYYISIYKQLTRYSFERWKVGVRADRLMLSRYFHRWDLRNSELKLARMNVRRLLYLTRDAVAKIRVVLMSCGLEQWRRSTVNERKRWHVRLLFRCWRTAVCAQMLRRRHAKLWVLRLLYHHRRVELVHFSYLHDTVVSSCSRVMRTSVWTWWRKRFEKSAALRGAIRCLLKAMCSRAMVVWRTNTIICSHSASPAKRLVEDLPPLQLLVQKQVIPMKRICARPLGVPSHLQPLYRDRERQLLCDKAHTPSDRLRFRWQQLQRSEAQVDAKKGLRSRSSYAVRGRVPF